MATVIDNILVVVVSFNPMKHQTITWSLKNHGLNSSSLTLDTESQRLINSEINHWQAVLLRIVSIIKMLGESCLAFQGKTDKLYERSNGNFLKLIQLLAEFDPVMQEHVRRILMKEEKKATYLSKNIQNELISIIFEKITSIIVEKVNQSKYYSIILDCTPDCSKTEQMTMIVRYVSIDQSSDNLKTEVIINESFWHLFLLKSLLVWN